MKIPNKFNPLGISKEQEGIPTRGLDFYLPLENNLNDAINGYTPKTDGIYFDIQNDTISSNIGYYGRFNSTWNITGSNINRAIRYLNTQSLCQYGTGDFTICFWIQAPNLKNSTNNAIFSKKGGSGKTGIAFNTNNSVYIRAETQTKTLSTDDAQTAKWIHWLYMRKNGIGYWYKNGVLNASAENSDDITNYDPNVSDINQLIIIGYNAQYSSSKAQFNMKSFRIYNRALSSSEIRALSEEFDVQYKVVASDQTFRFTPINKQYSISYSCIQTITSFEIISGELPSSISFNTTTGKFTGSALTDSNHTYNLIVRMSGTSIIPKEINVTINTVPVSDLSIPSPQTFDFITEKAVSQTIQINYENEQKSTIKTSIYSGSLPSGIAFFNIVGYNTCLVSKNTLDGPSQNQLVMAASSQFHPEPVYATINVNVSLNQITASDINFQAYTLDGASAKHVGYTSQNPITPVYTLNGTLPTGFSFDSQTGTFSYDGITATATSGTVQVTIASSTGLSAPATITVTLELIEGEKPWEAPSGDLVFYDSLSASSTWATPEIGGALTLKGSSPSTAIQNGINCSYFQNGGLSRYDQSYIGGYRSISMSIWLKCADVSRNWVGVYAIGRWLSRRSLEIFQNYDFLQIVGNLVTYTDINDIDVTKWHHIAVTYDYPARKYITYVDGVFYAEKTSISINFSSDIIIGANKSGTGTIPRDGYFDGYLAGVRLYNRVLTAEEVAVLSREFNPTT